MHGVVCRVDRDEIATLLNGRLFSSLHTRNCATVMPYYSYKKRNQVTRAFHGLVF